MQQIFSSALSHTGNRFVTKSPYTVQLSAMEQKTTKSFDLTDPHVVEAKELERLWLSAFQEGQWPDKEKLNAISNYLDGAVFEKTGRKRRCSLSGLITWSENQWELGLVALLYEFFRKMRPATVPLLSKLRRSEQDASTTLARNAFKDVFGETPRLWKEILEYDPAPPKYGGFSREAAAGLLKFCYPDLPGLLKNVPNEEYEWLATNLVWNQLQRDRLSSDWKMIVFVDWLTAIERFDLIEEIEEATFWPNALDVDGLKKKNPRLKERDKKRKQRAHTVKTNPHKGDIA